MPIRARHIEGGAVINAKLGADTSCRRGYIYEDFKSNVVAVAGLGAGAASGATGAVNIMATRMNIFEYHVKGAGQTILAPVLTAAGLNISLDQTSTEGLEITTGILARGESVFVIGTSSAFSFRVKAKIEDVSGCVPFAVGIRKSEAYQAAFADYADYAWFGLIDNTGLIKSSTEVAGGGATTTSSGITWADTTTRTLKVKVSAAGVVTYEVDGTSAPTAAYTFTAALTVIPSIFFLHGADVAGTVELLEWECGLDSLI